MKVFVCSADFEYQGYTEPLAVFSSKESAEKWCDNPPEEWVGCHLDITELEVQE